MDLWSSSPVREAGGVETTEGSLVTGSIPADRGHSVRPELFQPTRRSPKRALDEACAGQRNPPSHKGERLHIVDLKIITFALQTTNPRKA